MATNPTDITKMKNELSRNKKTFNVISIALIDAMTRVYGDNVTFSFLKTELDKFSKDKSADYVPAVKFFSTMNRVSNISYNGKEGVSVGELIMRKDEKLFGDECGVSVPILDALDMQNNWPKLSPANKEKVWDYLERMAKLSAKVVVGCHMMDGNVESVQNALASGNFESLNDIKNKYCN